MGQVVVTTDIYADFLTIEEAARAAGVSVATVLEWIRHGKVPVFYFAETETVH